MPYIFREVRTLQNAAKEGDGDCVELIRKHTNLRHTATWRQGAQVFGNKTIIPGTAVATFVKGRYPNRATGNHAAFYIGQQSEGIYIMDQWKGSGKPKISIRFLTTSNLSRKSLSDNPLAFYVVE